MMKPETDHKRVLLAIFLAGLVLIAWQMMVEGPRRQQLLRHNAEQAKLREATEQKRTAAAFRIAEPESNPSLSRDERIAQSPRVTIASDKLDGSIALKGARFDDLKLAKYRVSLDEDSPEVTLLSPAGDPQAYFVQVGWVSPDRSTPVPDHATPWQADKMNLTPGETVTLRWTNADNVTFLFLVSLDQYYMFTIEQRVQNHGARTVAVMPYAYINRTHDDTAMAYAIMHEGPLGVMHDTLEEISYADLREKNSKVYEQASGWLGITDKYWLTALIPGAGGYKATFSHYTRQGEARYQADYLGEGVQVPPGAAAAGSVRLFAGAKEIDALDRYAEGAGGKPPIPLFDRAVDFGMLYFLTKPMFLALSFFYDHMGNFGVAILLLTIVIKLLMYPLANKSYHSMAQMRELQPEMMKLRERHQGDAMAMNKAMMELYKREKVNPAAGCLPLLVQIPVFFALYKVLFVTIEMRHAPFFGWIRDLSAPDPSNLFTLFGLMPWDHPSWLHLGILPILFTVTMVIQMRQQPKPTDPIQAKMIAWMPYFFLFIFAGFPAGLVVYWIWSNILSIIQQQVIITRHKAHLARKKNKAN